MQHSLDTGNILTQRIMIAGMKKLGRARLRRTFDNGSKMAYDTKKMVKVALY
jgi:hypothetical protein